VDPVEFGPLVRNPVILSPGYPVRAGAEVRGSVIHIDRFGNLITNISDESGARIRKLGIGNHEILKRARYFSEALPGELFFIEGSTGTLEICVFHANAAELTGAQVGEPVFATL
ncbi:MAG: SAM-dependent chlorinase/fluorinase, partial [Acidobacteriota bacterium]|nr:SAM-dependent chlorinase/fluorinase [Acidobacteriota bacterium]